MSGESNGRLINEWEPRWKLKLSIGPTCGNPRVSMTKLTPKVMPTTPAISTGSE